MWATSQDYYGGYIKCPSPNHVAGVVRDFNPKPHIIDFVITAEPKLKMEKERQNLKKYYKYIKICKNPKCKKPYGVDRISRYQIALCPVCLPHSNTKVEGLL